MSQIAMRDSFASRYGSRTALLPTATFTDSLMTVLDVFLPTLAKGAIMRRPGVMALAERLDIDRRAIRRVQRLRERYGAGPVLMRVLGRSIAMILDPEHVHRVLDETPDPFETASREKVAALRHFEPKGSLISTGSEREVRRHFNEEALETHRPIHRMAESFAHVVTTEVKPLRSHTLTWDRFADAWFRIVRQVVFGRAARDDDELSDIMARLRRAANWAFLVPERPALRNDLLQRISGYLRRADSESLAGAAARIPVTAETAPEQQVPQWLFAFDAAGMATFRALALLASHPEHLLRARREIADRRGSLYLPYLRSAVLESIRLWPTTPLVLRESNSQTRWERGIMPQNTALVIFAPFFHRDQERLPFANQFTPHLWSDGRTAREWPLIPFSDGSAACPGRELVLLLATTTIAQFLGNAEADLQPPGRLSPDRPLPATLNHFSLRLDLRGDL